MKSKYHVRPDNREDWVDYTVTETEESVCLMTPVGQHAMLEVRDGRYFQGKTEPYHQHETGHEIFYLVKGRVGLTVRRKYCILEPGDMVFLPAGDPHGLHFLDEETVFRIFLQGMDVHQRRQNRNVIQQNYPEMWENPAFAARFARTTGAFPRLQPASVENVCKSELAEVRSQTYSQANFEFPCGTLRLVAGRWETSGLYEVWRCELHEVCRIIWDMPHPYWELFQVTAGTVEFKVLTETFVAKEGDLVRIPPYTRHSLKVLEENTVLHDMGCSIRQLSLLEDVQSMRKTSPEFFDNREGTEAFLEKYNCFVSYFGF